MGAKTGAGRMVKVLVIEDDAETAAEIKAALLEHGFEVESASDGRSGLLRAATEAYDAVVLDRMLPGGMEGLGVLSTLRAAGITTPVLVLSALSAVDERVRGLRAGGDDYLTKPFEFLELTARLDVLVRKRVATPPQTSLAVGGLHMDLLTHTVTHGCNAIDLLPREFKLLELLMRNAGRVVTRTMLFEEVWHYHFDRPTNVIDVHVSKLRRKLDLPGMPVIETVRGRGFMLHAPA